MSRLLDEKVAAQIVEIFNELSEPVEVLFFGSKDQHCDYCNETRTLLEEVSSLSENISLTLFDVGENQEIADLYGIERVPNFIIGKRDGDDFIDFGIRFVGIPAGHEFTSLINVLVMVSKGESGISEQGKSVLENLDHNVLLQVFVTPT